MGPELAFIALSRGEKAWNDKLTSGVWAPGGKCCGFGRR